MPSCLSRTRLLAFRLHTSTLMRLRQSPSLSSMTDSARRIKNRTFSMPACFCPFHVFSCPLPSVRGTVPCRRTAGRDLDLLGVGLTAYNLPPNSILGTPTYTTPSQHHSYVPDRTKLSTSSNFNRLTFGCVRSRYFVIVRKRVTRANLLIPQAGQGQPCLPQTSLF